MIKRILVFLFIACINAYGANAQASIHVVAAENFYGAIAKELGGPYVTVTSILQNPNQDPHLFTTSPRTAIAVSKADMIVYNGAGYDPWMKSLLATAHQNKHTIVVADLMYVQDGSNPHIWYKPETMSVYAKNVVNHLIQLDPSHRIYFRQQLNKFNQAYQPLTQKIKVLSARFKGTPVIATEPVFNYMAEAMNLDMHGKEFQINIMNDIPPSYSQAKQFEEDLRHHAVAVLIFNNQVINPTTKKMLSIAKEQNIPVVGVSETMPAGLTYIEWMMKQLRQFENALKIR